MSRILGEAGGIHYELYGDAAAPPLVLSSGLGGSAGYWTPNIPALARHYRVIAYDHRGTGRSDRALPDRVSVDDLARDMVLLLDALGIACAHVVGHAAGGVAGLAMALSAPERLDRLVVVNGWASADPHFLRCFEARLNLLRHSGIEAFLRAQPIFLYPADWISAHGAALDAELAHQLATFPGPATMEKRIAALAAFDVTGRLAHLSDRVLVLIAQDDMLVPPSAGRRLRDELGGCGMEVMPFGGHACNVTDPALFNHIVLRFLGS